MSPIYEYKCEKCNEKFEEFVDYDVNQLTCPVCNSLSNRTYDGVTFVSTGLPNGFNGSRAKK